MYKVEYLVLLDADKTSCKTVTALENLLQTDSGLSVTNGKIKFQRKIADLIIKSGRKSDKKHIYFNVVLKCKLEDDIEWFSSLLRSIRKSLALITESTYVVFDDLSLYYCQKAYPLIFTIENTMRQLITKFMHINVGLGWINDRLPDDVQKSVNSNNNDSNYLYNVDFIQLSNFLFSENYPNHKASLIKKIKSTKNTSDLKIEEIRALIPESNWDKYFKQIVDCDAEYFKKRWESLYELRCKVAHNKSFTKNCLIKVQEIFDDLNPIIDKAIESLDSISVTDDEKNALSVKLLGNYDPAFYKFISRTHRLELILDLMLEKFLPHNSALHSRSTMQKVKSLHVNGYINDKQQKSCIQQQM